MSDRCQACALGLHCGLCACCPSRRATPESPDGTRTVRLTSRDPLRLSLLTSAQVRAAVGCECGALAGHPCVRWKDGDVVFTTTNHRSRIIAARARSHGQHPAQP